MENLSLIVAIGKNNELGKDNKLLWHLPNDLKYFKEKTLNKFIIMGRKTFESLPKMLPNRKHIIITNKQNLKIDDALVFHNLDETINFIKETKEECFIIGGASVYKLFLPYCKNLYITEIEDSKEADVFFPKFDKKNYKRIVIKKGEDDKIKYSFIKYEKIR